MTADRFEIDLEHAEAILPRYSGPGPRYTSYPTAPVWSERVGPRDFARALAGAGARADRGLSVYVHVPFCRSLCHYCACNRVITRREEPVERYLDTVEREVARVREAVGAERRVSQHHWGGGTPTHLSPAQVRRLFRAVDDAFPLAPGAEVSIEVDPRVTTAEHVEALRACGMNRISMGVQDFDPKVQEAVHRVQPVEQTAALLDLARRAGFRSAGFDLIYGLPFQTLESFGRTLDSVIGLAPDRIAVYSYAHVTWVAKQQRGFERKDLPDPRTKLRLFLLALRRLLEAGYVYVGMDHFARADDDLVAALGERTLRRNFMGYTTQAGVDLIGFGPSAISELSEGFFQSHRDLEDWERAVRAGTLATLRGHELCDDDRARRFVIARIMCLGELSAREYRDRFGADFADRHAGELARLEPLAADGLVEIEPDGSLRLTALGRLLVRNVAMAFDAYLPAQQRSERPLFSATV